MHPAHQPSAFNSHRLIHRAIALRFFTTIGSLSVTAALFLSQASYSAEMNASENARSLSAQAAQVKARNQKNSDLTGAAAENNKTAQLRDFLNEQNWGAADRETRRLLSGEDYPYGPNIATVPLELIRAIDEAWLAASDGRFGLSVQAKIWAAAVAAHPNDRDMAVNDFRDRVGWKLTAPRAEVDFISSDWLNESELNYSLQAPMGHLPWAGVPDAAVQGLLSETVNGCGSCTTDAMQLRNERFYLYLPELFSRVQVALSTSVPIAQAWRSPTLLHQINLTALYPSGSSVRPTTQAISPNSQTLAVASRSSSHSALALWNLATGTRRVTLLKPEAGVPEARAIAFSTNSQQLFAGLSNGNIQIWETSQGKSLRSWTAHSGGVRAIALSTGGNIVVSGGDTTLKVWDSTGRLLRTLQLSAGESQPSAVQSVQISPDNQRLAVATGRTIQLWNIGTGQLIKVTVSTTAQNQTTFGPSLPQAMAFSPDSRYLATLDTDNSIKLWDASNGARVITLRQHQHPIQALAFRPDGQTLISRDANQSVLFWNLSTFQSDRSISVASGNAPGPVDTSDAIATPQPIILSPDGQIFVVPLTSADFPQSRFAVDLRAVVTGDRITVLPGVESGSFSPDNRFFVTQGEALQVWQP